nr:MAG TPA: hypothetical protein [Caudoviricetes sp.]
MYILYHRIYSLSRTFSKNIQYGLMNKKRPGNSGKSTKKEGNG